MPRETESTEKQYWNLLAADFDNEADHGLTSHALNLEWTRLIQKHLSASRKLCIDLGCGTGSISRILSRDFLEVEAVDFAPAMLELAKSKNKDLHNITYFEGDAFSIRREKRFDFVFCRHMLWMCPDVMQTLNHWHTILEKNGIMVLIEGFWSTGVGLSRDSIVEGLNECGLKFKIEELSENERLWGRPVGDSRYLIRIEA